MTDEPAFPHTEPRDPRLSATRPGLTKREAYAIAALPALITALAGKGDDSDDFLTAMAVTAFACADAMIEAGKVKP